MELNFEEINLLLFQVKRDPQMVMDIINEEEAQFLKTLNRGRNLLERTIGKLNGQTILPGMFSYSFHCTITDNNLRGETTFLNEWIDNSHTKFDDKSISYEQELNEPKE